MTKQICLDVGTTKSAYAVTEFDETKQLVLQDFGIVDNETLLGIVEYQTHRRQCDLVYEEFACYGMPIGETTMHSILWNGRFIQVAKGKVIPIKRMQVKMNLCHTPKAKDSNIRQALIDRFGGVGTKGCPGTFYGVSKDIWSAIAIAVTRMDMEKM